MAPFLRRCPTLAGLLLFALFLFGAAPSALAHCPPVQSPQNFDSMRAPLLPAGLVASQGVNVTGAPLWVTSNVIPHTAPNDLFSTAPDNLLDNRIDIPVYATPFDYVIFLQNNYNLESGRDGAVLEISVPSINGGAFTDITDPAVNGSISPGYNSTISTAFQSPIAGRMAWSGNSGGYVSTLINLGNAAFLPPLPANVILRFRLASDNSGSSAGWRIDSFSFLHSECPTPSPSPTASPTPTATATPIASPCGGPNLIADPTFEAGNPWPNWTVQTSTNFGTPLCNTAACGTGEGTAPPYAGDNWAWFGGAPLAETATLGQSVLIPMGAQATLSFVMRIGRVSSPYTDVLSVKVDGTTVHSYPEPDQAEVSYTLRTIDLSAFADGASHLILFEYIGSTTGTGNYVVDNVTLATGPACSSPTPTATATTPTPTPPTVIVTNTNDSGPGSLRQALADAHDGDIIGFDPALNGQTILLTSSELLVNKDISISGPGSDLLRVSRSLNTPQEFRIIHIMPSHTVAIQGLTIYAGYLPKFGPPPPGAGIFNEQGTLTIDSCTVSGNYCFCDGGGISNTGTLAVSHSAIIFNVGSFGGGGISNSGTLTITNSMVSNNLSGDAGVGPGTGHGAGISNTGMATIVSSTIDHNTADGGNQGSGSIGGGINNAGSGSLTVSDSTISQNVAVIAGGAISGGGSITNCTISANTAPQGAAIYRGGSITNCTISDNTASQNGASIYATVASALEIGNTILNAGANGANIRNEGGTVTSHGYNVSSDNGAGFLTAPGDQINTDPLLGPLQDNGGPTFTHELLPGSPAINGGDPNFTPPPFYDQRGPGYDRVFSGRLDIGSFEVQLVQPTPTATATPTASPTPTPTATASPSPPTAQLLNLSTRVRVETGDNVMIGGFIITGAGSLQVVIRGIGPSLGQQGISDFLPDPILELRDSRGSLLATNDNWQDDPTQATQLLMLGLAPRNQAESALVRSLPPGAYTAIIAGKNGGTGVGLVEVYNVDRSVPVANIELANISTRGFVQTGDNVMIGGFILGSGNNTGVVVRGIGPTLAQFGLSNVLADPTLEFRDSNGTLLVANDNWQDDPAAAGQLTAHGLAPQNPLESGIFMSLPPGAFTAILAGKNGGTGIGLVEIYNVH